VIKKKKKKKISLLAFREKSRYLFSWDYLTSQRYSSHAHARSAPEKKIVLRAHDRSDEEEDIHAHAHALITNARA
jgi:hypothetical protein